MQCVRLVGRNLCPQFGCLPYLGLHERDISIAHRAACGDGSFHNPFEPHFKEPRQLRAIYFSALVFNGDEWVKKFLFNLSPVWRLILPREGIVSVTNCFLSCLPSLYPILPSLALPSYVA